MCSITSIIDAPSSEAVANGSPWFRSATSAGRPVARSARALVAE
jgi:hypothetical protein